MTDKEFSAMENRIADLFKWAEDEDPRFLGGKIQEMVDVLNDGQVAGPPIDLRRKKKVLELAEQKALDQMIVAVTNEQLVRADAGLPSRFGIQEAAVATGMSTSAIRRAIKAGKIEVTRHPITNAYEMSASALIAAGYRLSSPKQEPAPSAPDNSAELDYLRQRIKDLEEALAYERQRNLSADERLDLVLQALPRRLFSRKSLKPGNPSA